MREIPVSVWYGVGSVTPQVNGEVMQRDLRTMRELGFKFVRGWVNWRDSEPRPGDYDFQYLDRLFNFSSTIDMRVILQVYLEFAPDWLMREIPDSLYVSESGSKVIPGGSPGVCLDSPKARSFAESFLRRLAEKAKGSDNFYAWDVWSEPLTIQWVYQPSQWRGLFCYCENSIRRFRDWISKRYGRVEALNRAWHRSYRGFDEVEPPRFVSLHYAKENLDWITFNLEKLRQDLEWRVRVIKGVDPDHPVTSHTHGGTSALANPLFGNPDDWEMAKVVDFWGTSLYPKHAGRRREDPCLDSFVLDFTRSASQASGKGFWIGELQGGQGVGGIRIVDPVRPEEIAVWMWQSIAHGAMGLNIYHWYPMMLGYESSGYGLVNPDGSVTERARAAGSEAKLVEDYSQLLFSANQPKAEVGILYNVDAYKAMWILQPSEAIYRPGGFRDVTLISGAMLGIYRTLWEESIPVDFVSLEQVERGNLGYKLLFAPSSFAIRETFAKSLKEFVRGGGALYSDSRFGWIREDGFIDVEVPSYGLGEVLGGVEEEVRSVDKSTIWITSDQVLPGLRRGDSVEGVAFESSLRTSTGEVGGITEGGREVLVLNSYGKGISLYVGTNLGLAVESTGSASARRAISAVAERVGVNRPLRVLGSTIPRANVEFRTLSLGSETLLFAINYSWDKVAIEVELNLSEPSRAVELLRGSEVKLRGRRLGLKLSPKGVQLIRLS
jgi:beta-galactosidase